MRLFPRQDLLALRPLVGRHREIGPSQTNFHGAKPKENSAFMPYMCGLADDRLAWASAHGVEMEEVYGHWREQARGRI
jgi:hypothetical protein